MSSSMKSASVYLRKGNYFIHPLAGSKGSDPCLFIGPVVKLASDAGMHALGDAVTRALRASRHDEPWPTQWKGFTQPLYDAAGVKNESSFQKGLKVVRINQQAGSVEILPTTSTGPGTGSAPLLGQLIKLTDPDPHALGAAVLNALDISD